MTRMDKILNKVSDFLVTLQKLTGHWIWMVTEDVRSEELEMILPMRARANKLDSYSSKHRRPIGI